MDSWFIQHPEIVRYILKHEAKRHQIEQDQQELPEWAQEPALRECPYCHQMHKVEQIEQCPLKPKMV